MLNSLSNLLNEAVYVPNEKADKIKFKITVQDHCFSSSILPDFRQSIIDG